MKIVSIGAHPDDVEQGMGGTVAKHSDKGDDVHIILCSLGGVCGDPVTREQEANAAARILGAKLHSLDYPILKLNKPSTEFKNLMKRTIDNIQPDRVYVHSPFDYHQVHVVVSKCVAMAAGHVKQLIYYEGISSTNPDFKPNAYVDITDYLDLKLKSVAAHKSQSNRLYLQPHITRSLASIRYVLGKIGSNPYGMAEAFTIFSFMISDITDLQ